MQETKNSGENTSSQSSVQTKDFMIPVSIIVAGALVGVGLYFGGGQGSATGSNNLAGNNNNQQQQQQEQSGDLEAIDEVTEEDHIKGSVDAPIKIVEYSDFDCPFCSRFHDTMNSIVDEYEGEVAWVYRQFPIEQLHPQAPAVALASECVADLGGNDAFWTFTDGYFEAKSAGGQTDHATLVPQLASEAGVSDAAFNECFDNQEFSQNVQDDMNDATETGGRGTPWSILIGPSGKKYPINGALPQASVEQLIETAQQEA